MTSTGSSTTEREPTLAEAIGRITLLLERLAAPQNTEQLIENLSSNITEFHFDPEEGVTFDRWFSRYSDLFESDAKNLDDAAKVRLLLRKLETSVHTRYINFILPKLPKDVTFKDTVETLKRIFGQPTSVFNKRFQCLQLVKTGGEDIVTYGGKVNRMCEEFDFNRMTIDQFKCLVFICGLRSPQYNDIRVRLLAKIESETEADPTTLQSLVDEYQRLSNLKRDTAIIEGNLPPNHVIHSVQSESDSKIQQPHNIPSNKKLPPSPCWQCGEMHFVRDCTYSEHTCKSCNKVGHKEGYCSCQPTKKKGSFKASTMTVYSELPDAVGSRRRYTTPTINGVPCTLQLDTASDITLISRSTWTKLGKPTLSCSDLQAITASGDSLKIDGELRCQVKINNVTMSTICYVTSHSIDLLGNDWMGEFKLWSVPLDTICNKVNVHNDTFKQCHSNTSVFQTGDIVKIKQHRAKIWTWTYGTIIETIGDCTYNILLDHNNKLVRRHFSQMRVHVRSGRSCD